MRDGDPDAEARALAGRVLAARGALGEAASAVAAAAAPTDVLCAVRMPNYCWLALCLTWWNALGQRSDVRGAEHVQLPRY